MGRRHARVGDDARRRRTTTSVHLPTVGGREPLWENPPDQPVVVGLRSDVRDVLITHVLDARAGSSNGVSRAVHLAVLHRAGDAAMFIGSIFTPWAVVFGAVPVFVALTGWFWPKAGETGTQPWPIRPSHTAEAGRSAGGSTV